MDITNDKLDILCNHFKCLSLNSRYTEVNMRYLTDNPK